MKKSTLIRSLFWQWRAKRNASSNVEQRQSTIDEFHKLYYDLGAASGTWTNTSWFGVRTAKCPLDLWLYQEILHEIKPDFIFEAGTATGGSALYLAHLCDLLGQGEILTVDIARQEYPKHPRITYITDSSISDATVRLVEEKSKKARTTLIILDSDHSKSHVLQELRIFNKYVTPGSYLIVEDSNVNGHPVFPEHGAGPWEAVEEFLKENNDFLVDESKHKFLVSFNPRGYLKRKTV